MQILVLVRVKNVLSPLGVTYCMLIKINITMIVFIMAGWNFPTWSPSLIPSEYCWFLNWVNFKQLSSCCLGK